MVKNLPANAGNSKCILTLFPSFSECITIILIFYFCRVQGNNSLNKLEMLNVKVKMFNTNIFTHQTLKSLRVCSRLKETKETCNQN